MRVFHLVLVALVAEGTIATVQALDVPPLRPEGFPRFTADVAVSLDPNGHAQVGVTLSLPYRELQWRKAPGGYSALAEFVVVFEPREKGLQHGDAWGRELAVRSFDATTSSVLAMIERRTFKLPAGRYALRVQVRDAQSEHASSASAELEVPDYSRMLVGFADLELGVVDSSGAFTAAAARRFGRNVRNLAARLAFFDRREGAWPRTYPLRFRIRDEFGNEVSAGQQETVVSGSPEPVLVRPDSTDLFLGSYRFEVELPEGKPHPRVERSFEVEESGPPRGRVFEQMLEPLALIAEPREIARLRALAVDEQAAGWEDFWGRRDPTPDTPRNEALLEFFRRVRYVSSHFQGFGPGWRSDMGRVYIKHGPPEQVENRPATSQGSQIEVWHYANPYRRFVFMDRDGFGRYVLISPGSE